MGKTKREKVIQGLKCCNPNEYHCGVCLYDDGYESCARCKPALHLDAITLLKTQKPNGEQYQCNKCKFYQGVHNVMGHAPCSFWNIGGVMWNDYCSRFSQFMDK